MTDDHAKPWETTRRGLLLLVSSPAGAGKTSLSRRLVADHADMTLSISATTRDARPGEEEGREYFFIDRPTFEAKIAELRALAARHDLPLVSVADLVAHRLAHDPDVVQHVVTTRLPTRHGLFTAHGYRDVLGRALGI